MRYTNDKCVVIDRPNRTNPKTRIKKNFIARSFAPFIRIGPSRHLESTERAGDILEDIVSSTKGCRLSIRLLYRFDSVNQRNVGSKINLEIYVCTLKPFPGASSTSCLAMSFVHSRYSFGISESHSQSRLFT